MLRENNLVWLKGTVHPKLEMLQLVPPLPGELPKMDKSPKKEIKKQKTNKYPSGTSDNTTRPKLIV